MLKGEIWRYEPKGSPRVRAVLLVSSDGINRNPGRRELLACDVVRQDPVDLLAVPLSDGTALGWARVDQITRIYREWLSDRIAVVDQTSLVRVEQALRLALDL
jgi:mRNA-degrading endonuclease toxin of MazEF toxin-antitoxin module